MASRTLVWFFVQPASCSPSSHEAGSFIPNKIAPCSLVFISDANVFNALLNIGQSLYAWGLIFSLVSHDKIF
ncbi:hypothetical protein KTT_31800 [Tengunoibacter tsumagoiensis]|uniref:Uncharacterized protein n=1 Tax=Tengunoibacter tsumagoiensis TaxID=2014871 RepID=A0A402A2T3_9CHLR|nr:hypothetical protein KTT_31800 [Tengunoibacter tsumagoiensis]